MASVFTAVTLKVKEPKMATSKHILGELAVFLGAGLRGDAECVITNIAPLNAAKSGDISFLENPGYKSYLATTAASAVILREEDLSGVPATLSVLVVKVPYVAYAKISALFADIPRVDSGVHPTAVIGHGCHIDSTAAIAAHVVVGNNVVIGKNVTIESGCVIGDRVIIGDDTRLYANVTIYYGVRIGKCSTLHSGAVIGSDGFGMANENGVWRKIYQLGTVVIGDDVEIGANTTVDRGALADTVIGDDVKLDNQIQIGHNVRIGAHTAIAGSTGIAGSTTIGKHCMIGGGCGINGHITIADGVIITARSNVYKSIPGRDIYASAIPAVSHRVWWRILKRIFQLDELSNRVKKLEKKCYE